MGFFQSIYGLGVFLGPVLVGISSNLGGLNIGFWFTGIIGFIAAVLTYFGKNVKAIINSIGNARENSLVISIK